LVLAEQIGKDPGDNQRAAIRIFHIGLVAQFGKALPGDGKLIAGHGAAEPLDLLGAKRRRLEHEFANVDVFKRCQGRGTPPNGAGDSWTNHAFIPPLFRCDSSSLDSGWPGNELPNAAFCQAAR
jgi:hypothetical protein